MDGVIKGKSGLSRAQRDFPGGPLVKISYFQRRGVWVQSPVRKLRSHMLQNGEKIKARKQI